VLWHDYFKNSSYVKEGKYKTSTRLVGKQLNEWNHITIDGERRLLHKTSERTQRDFKYGLDALRFIQVYHDMILREKAEPLRKELRKVKWQIRAKKCKET
jgi:hypothetical protein